MSSFVVIAADAVTIVLAVIFLVSGISKLGDTRTTAQILRGFGIRIANRSLGATLALVEVLSSFALLSGGFEVYGALAVTMLGILFSVGIGWNLARGRRPECGCFGALASSRINGKSLVRSFAITAGGIWVTLLAWPQAGIGPAYLLMRDTGNALTVGRIAALEFGLLICLATLFAIERKRTNLLRASVRQLQGVLGPFGVPGSRGLAMGSTAPDFSVMGKDGQAMNLLSFIEPAKPLLLFFLDPMSAVCRSLAADIAEWQAEHGRLVTLGVLSDGPPAAARDTFGPFGIIRLGLQSAHETRDSYGCPATPGAVALSPDGRVVSPVAVGGQAVRDLWLRQLQQARSALSSQEGAASVPVAVPQ